MAETVVVPSTPAANIAKAVEAKTNGKPSNQKVEAKPDSQPVVDPNAGKERYVVDGKERWLSPDQAKAYVQKGLAFEPKVSELARLQQETQQLFELMKNDPAKVLFNKQIGLTPELALQKILGSSKVSDELKEVLGNWYYENVIKLNKMTPEQRENLELKREKADRDAREKQQSEDAVARDNMARVQAAEKMLKQQLSEALKEVTIVKDLDSPFGVQVAKRIFDVMRMSQTSKAPLTPKQAAERVQKEIRDFHVMYLDEKTDDEIVAEIGEKNAEKVRKFFLKAVKAQEKEKGMTGQQAIPKRNERQTMNLDDFHDRLDRIKRGEE